MINNVTLQQHSAADDHELYPASYYATTLNTRTTWPQLSGHEETDVCIIGGGLAGTATALSLAQKSRSVILLEEHRVGWGASGRNGGFVAPGYPISMITLAKRVGYKAARELWSLSVDGLDIVRQRAIRFSSGTYANQGTIVCQLAGYPEKLSSYIDVMNEKFSADFAFISGPELRDMLVTDRYTSAYHDPSSFLIHPLNLVRGMASDAVRLGVRVYEKSKACALTSHRGRKWVMTAQGNVQAKHLVIAGGAYIDFQLSHRLGLGTVPVSSFALVTDPIPEQLQCAIRTKLGVSDTRLIPDYYRVLPDARLLWGGRASPYSLNVARIKNQLIKDIVSIYPQLSQLTVHSVWNGRMSFARHEMPIIMQITDGTWLASGFGGQGIATATMAGMLISSAITDGDDRYRQFERFGLPFVGGRLLGGAAFHFITLQRRLSERLFGNQI